ncbi:hypothetical protein KEM54_004408, partial [Ascosphaera aggregata]
MELEEARGPLRPYGRGEGDSSALVENLYFNCPNGSLAESPVLWEGGHYYIHNPAASKPFSYGYCDSFGVGSPLITDKPIPEPVGLSDLCTLNVNAQMVWRHHQSYLDNIHILHPILEENSLIRLVEDFIRNYSFSSFPPAATPTSGAGAGAGSPTLMPTGNMIRPLKRKRSSENGIIDIPPPQQQQQQQQQQQPPSWIQERTASNTIHRSIENSI